MVVSGSYLVVLAGVPQQVVMVVSYGSYGSYLVVLAGVPQQVGEEGEARGLADQDEVGGAVGQVGGGGQALGAAGARAAHAHRVDGQELPPHTAPGRPWVRGQRSEVRGQSLSDVGAFDFDESNRLIYFSSFCYYVFLK